MFYQRQAENYIAGKMSLSQEMEVVLFAFFSQRERQRIRAVMLLRNV